MSLNDDYYSLQCHVRTTIIMLALQPQQARQLNSTLTRIWSGGRDSLANSERLGESLRSFGEFSEKIYYLRSGYR